MVTKEEMKALDEIDKSLIKSNKDRRRRFQTAKYERYKSARAELFFNLFEGNSENRKIESVEEQKDSYEIHLKDGLSIFLDKKWDIVPKSGDAVTTVGKGGWGSVIKGIAINQELAFYMTDKRREQDRKAWIEKTKKEHAEEYKKLMKDIKDEESFTTADISGMGSGYERACQKMLRAGMKFLETNPDFEFPNYKMYKNVYGIATSKEPNAEILDKVVSDAAEPGGCTGAMHQCVIGHLFYIHENGYNKWLEKLKDRQYEYPSGLPASSFGKK